MNNLAQQTLADYVELFLSHLQENKNSSPKTIENYSLRLGRFMEFVGDIAPEQLKSLMVLNFRLTLKKRNLSIKTINYHIVALRSFLKFLLRNDIDTMSPDKCDLAKIEPREVSYLTEDELEKLL